MDPTVSSSILTIIDVIQKTCLQVPSPPPMPSLIVYILPLRVVSENLCCWPKTDPQGKLLHGEKFCSFGKTQWFLKKMPVGCCRPTHADLMGGSWCLNPDIVGLHLFEQASWLKEMAKLIWVHCLSHLLFSLFLTVPDYRLTTDVHGTITVYWLSANCLSVNTVSCALECVQEAGQRKHWHLIWCWTGTEKCKKG